MLDLKGYKVDNISFKNSAKNGARLNLKPHFTYNVNYMSAENKCVGILNYNFSDDENEFSITVNMLGFFDYTEDEDKVDIHVNSFAQIFPYVRQIISSVTAMSGAPALIVPIMKLDRNAVRVENKDEGEDDSPLN